MRTKLFFLLLLICSVNSFSQEKQEFKFENGTIGYWVKGNEGWGVEDKSGKTIVPKVFNRLYCYGNMIYCKEKKNGKKHSCELYNSYGECKIKEADGYTNLDFFISNGKWFASCSFSIRVPASVFDENGNMIYKYKKLKDAAGFDYLINELADTIVIGPGTYRGIATFRISGDVIYTHIGEKVGIVNLDGTMVIPAHTFCSITRDGSKKTQGFKVSKSSHTLSNAGFEGYYDRQGRCIISANKFTSVYPQENGVFIVKENGKASVIDSFGNVIFKTKYSGLTLAKDEHGKWYYETYLGNGKGKISEDGKLIEEVKTTIKKSEKKTNKNFTYIEVLSTEGLYGATNISGATLIPCEYDWISYDDFYASKINGFNIVKNGTVGFANNEGKIIIPCGKYDGITSLQGDGDFFNVEYMGRKGLCDKNGKELIRPIYDDINIRNGVIYAKVGIMEGVLDINGNVIVPFEYTDVSFDSETGNYEVKLFNKKGICNKKGQIIIPACYTSIITYDYNTGPLGTIYMVEDGKTEGIYSIDGKMIFPTTLFENISISNKNTGLPFNNEWFIMAYNDNKEHACYYDFDGHLLYDNRKEKLFDNYFKLGGNEFDKKNYKKAINYYNKALSVKKDGIVYYNIGAAYYNLGKYKKAINSLSSCTEVCKSQNIQDKATDLIIECKLCLQQKRQRRTNFWLGFVGTAINVANTVSQSNTILSNYNSGANITYFNNGNKSNSMDYLLDPRYTMMQVQQQDWNEYLQMTNGGQAMTYEEWNSLKAQAYMESNGQKSYNNENVNTSHNDYEKRKKDILNQTVGEICTHCKGSGKCPACNGTKVAQSFGNTYKCNVCNSNGDCPVCHGTKKTTWNK